MPSSAPISVRRRPLGRRLLARARYYAAILRSFKGSLALFAALLVGGTLLLKALYRGPDGGTITYERAFHATFTMMFMEFSLDYPDGVPALQALWVAAPVLGLTIVAESLVRFAVTIFNVQHRKEDWVVAVASTMKGHTVVCGLGRLGFRVVRHLRREGREVAVVERKPDGDFVAEIEALDVPIVVGDATKPAVLRRANVEAARAILVLTDDDLVNLDVGLAAREVNKDVKVVLRLFDESLADKVKRALGVEAAFSTSALAAPAFAAAAFSSRVMHSIDVGDAQVHLAELTAGARSPLVGRRLGDLEHEFDVKFLIHRSAGRGDLLPQAEVEVAAGDVLVVLARLEDVDRLVALSSAGGAPASVAP